MTNWPEYLALANSFWVPEFALAFDANALLRVWGGVVFIETDLAAPIHVSVRQPVENEQLRLEFSHFARCRRKQAVVELPRLCT